MANKLVHLRIPEKLYKDAVKIVKEKGYRNVQEFVLESLRNAVNDYYSKDVLKILKREIRKHSKL